MGESECFGPAQKRVNLTADVVEISEFIYIAQRYRVQGVPKTVVNDHIEIMGAARASLCARGAQSDRAAAKTAPHLACEPLKRKAAAKGM